jgi:hypothetical protein
MAREAIPQVLRSKGSPTRLSVARDMPVVISPLVHKNDGRNLLRCKDDESHGDRLFRHPQDEVAPCV